MCIVNGESRPDTKGRGGFRFDDEKIQYNCFNCGYATGWSPGKRLSFRMRKLLQQFGADESDVQRLVLELMREDEMAALLYRQQQREAPVVIDWPDMELPEGAVPFMDYPEPDNDWISAATYLTERGFDIEDENFLYSPATAPARMNKRFIVKFTYQGRIVGYTARWAGETPKDMPKYYIKQPPKNFVYGLDKQTSDKSVVIVTEGPLDAIVTDGVAVGSNNMNMEQGNIIDSLNKRVILLPDRDKAGIKLIEQAIERGWHVSFPEWEDCKDAGDAQIKYGRLYTVRSILDAAISSPTKIRVLAKKYCK